VSVTIYSDSQTEIPGEHFELRLSNPTNATLSQTARTMRIVIVDKDADNEIWVWGANERGGLGTGDKQFVEFPRAVLPELWGATELVMGGWVSFALLPDGTVWSWGTNYRGYLGNPNRATDGEEQFLPARIPGLNDIVSLRYGIALDAYGDLWAWGDNRYGSTGLGSQDASISSPQRMPISNVIDFEYGIAIRSDGTTWTWGHSDWNGHGLQVGSHLYSPQQLTSVPTAVEVSSRTGTTMVRTANGQVWGWGSNSRGQLGSGTDQDVAVPTRLPQLEGFAALEPGVGYMSDGRVFVWGNNSWAELALGFTGPPILSPTENTNLYGFTYVSLYGGIDANGGVWAWGTQSNENRLGLGHTQDVLSPERLGALRATQLSYSGILRIP